MRARVAATARAVAPLLVAACTKTEPRVDAVPVSSAPAALDAAPTAVLPEADVRDVADAAPGDRPRGSARDLTPFATGAPVSGKSIGHTSVVFKVRLDSGEEAAWKPRSKRGGYRYRGEIAAFRLAVALRLSNVPPALPRSFRMSALRTAFGDPASGAGRLLAEEAIPDDKGDVRGAIIPWIKDLRFLALEAEPKRSEWRAWLTSGGPPSAEDAPLARQISTLIVFDYLTANWDRWSGGQIGSDGRGEVLFLDNDGAFFDPPPPGPLAAQRALLASCARFSRSFVAAIRALDPTAARAAIGDDAPGEPLLGERVLAGLEERRKIALALVDARVAQDSEDKVLAFE